MTTESSGPTANNLLPLEVVNFASSGNTSCGDCVSACCTANVAMPLSPTEAQFLTDAGTLLEQVASPYGSKFTKAERREGTVFYKLLTDCGNLEKPADGGPGICKAFNSPERPNICSEFKPGSFCCTALKQRAARKAQREFKIPEQATSSE